jgi:transcriptional antiterminator RfaH|tara:strand:- start:669 stop:1181 length:513 start_codon:yes stop_codon:yes gene_type:complete
MEPIKKSTNWFAVYTKSRSEQKVFERIEKAGYKSFLPLTTELRQWSDRKKEVKVPLISSYVFIKVNKKDLVDIYSIPGVAGVLKYLGLPAIITEVEINNLKIVANNRGATKTIAPFLLENGKSVQVIKGPFEGLIAVCLSNNGKHRIIVKIEALNSFSEISLPLSHIKII